MQSQWAHRKDEHWLDSFLCVCPLTERDWEREREKGRERERERGERERERERGGDREREREKERKRKRGKRGERRLDSQDLPSFRAKLLFHFFARENKPLSRQWVVWQCSEARPGSHACATATIMAPSLRQTLHCRSHVRFLPPFFYGWLRTVRFHRPLSELSSGPLYELATIFLFSSPSVIELSTLTCTSTRTMFECPDIDFCKTGICSGLLCWGKCTSGAKHN